MSDPPQPITPTSSGSHSSEPAPSPRRILALDVGDRRIGLALSDPLGYTAQPLFTLHRTNLRLDLRSLARVLRKYAVTDIVVGLPLHASGDSSPQAAKSRSFGEALKNLHPGVALHLLDERLTTAEAHHLLNRTRSGTHSKSSRKERTSIIDQVAAVVLLEAFLSASSPRLLPSPAELLDH